MKYYSMSGLNNPNFAVVSADRELTYDYLESLVDPADWEPVSLATDTGILVDYPPSDMIGWGTLCSERLRNSLEEFAEFFIWLKVIISYAGGQHTYYELHAVTYPDVLDEGKTIRNKATGSVIKPVFSSEKIGDKHLFMPFRGGVNPVCSEHVKHLVEKEGFTGIEFVQRPVS